MNLPVDTSLPFYTTMILSTALSGRLQYIISRKVLWFIQYAYYGVHNLSPIDRAIVPPEDSPSLTYFYPSYGGKN